MNRTRHLLIAALAAAAGGCQDALNAYRTPPFPAVRRRRVVAPTAVVPAVDVVTARNGNPHASPTSNPGDDPPQEYKLLVRTKVVTIEVPAGTVSSSERIWNQLDEEIVGREVLLTLGRNGLRVGVGPRASWPDVARVLKKLTGRPLKQTMLMSTPSQPVPYSVKQRQGVQTIFVFHPDRTCSGADYPPGDNLLTLACMFEPDNPKKLMAVGVPQIRTTRQKTRIIRSGGKLRVVDRPMLFSFDPLTFRLQFNAGDFIVFGPSRQAARAGSVGSHFLIKRKRGVPFETVLVLIPEVVAAPVRPREKAPLGGLRAPGSGS